MRPKLYLANPLGFSELGTISLSVLEAMLAEKFEVHEPFSETPKSTLDYILKCTEKKDVYGLQIIYREIAQRNLEAIDNSDIVFAILDGTDVDSGTAAEMGYALAKGKTVYGLRSDFRYCGDSIGDKINIQVKYCIYKSGGLYFESLEEVKEWIETK